jgi:hypothetical protein
VLFWSGSGWRGWFKRFKRFKWFLVGAYILKKRKGFEGF